MKEKSWFWRRWFTSGRDPDKQPAAALNAPENQSILGDADDGNQDNAGLKVLYNPKESDLEIEADIVCIHGLGGHREETWTAKEPGTGRMVLWIKDFLPVDLPNARIMTYGYSSHIFSVRHLTQRTLYSQCKTLLIALKRSRQDIGATNRPLIFISHSLGGLIVKSALIHADKDDHVFNDIRVCTAGVVFFGTPHQGTPDVSWTKIVGDLISPEIDLNRIRDTLDSDLNWLQFQLEQYKSLDGVFPTYCVYEDEGFRSNSKTSMGIPRVAAIPLELLNTATLLTDPRQELHENLCKFQSRDSEYRNVMKKLHIMCEKSRDLVNKNIILDHVRRDPPTVTDTYGDTFCILMNPSQSRIEPFLGRDTELRTIHSYLGAQPSQRLMTLLGPPGIGKTQIALEYAWKYRKHYSSVLWVDAQNRFALHSSFLKFAGQLKDHCIRISGSKEQLKALHLLHLGGLIDDIGQVQSCQDSPELLFLVFRKWLERPSNNGWLLIIDGMDRENDLREFNIDEFLDSPINGHVIITSQTLRRGLKLDIHELEPSDAMKLLCQTTGPGEIRDSDMRELVNKLERLPLAIKQAGAFLSSSRWPIHKYCESLSLNSQSRSKMAARTSHSPLQNAWSISIQQLDQNTVELLGTIAFLSDYDISIEFIKSGVNSSSQPHFAVDESLTTLKRFSLVRYDSAAQTVALGSCMPEWLRESSKEDAPDNYRLRAKTACLSVSSYLKSSMAHVNSITYTAKQYRLEEQLLPYIERCADYVSFLSRHDADWETLGDTCRRQGRHDLAKRYYEIVVSDYRQIPLRAEILLQDLHDMEHSLGPAHIRTLGCAVLLASRFQEEGQHAKAEIIWRRANSSQSKTLGNFHPLTLKTAARLALTLRQQGKYRQAKEIYLSTCKATAIVLGDDHPDSLRLMVNIALMCTLERHFNEADQEYRKVLGKMEEKLGRDHEDVKRTKMYMALNNEQKQPDVGGAGEGFLIESLRIDGLNS
ncbi:hypothetical protein F4803DRAFT_557878 [Xylaria telfairii]|nr:hypothetical protein F4803DRAFT_557878 [Xylaria telfairii]